MSSWFSSLLDAMFTGSMRIGTSVNQSMTIPDTVTYIQRCYISLELRCHFVSVVEVADSIQWDKKVSRAAMVLCIFLTVFTYKTSQAQTGVDCLANGERKAILQQLCLVRKQSCLGT